MNLGGDGYGAGRRARTGARKVKTHGLGNAPTPKGPMETEASMCF